MKFNALPRLILAGTNYFITAVRRRNIDSFIKLSSAKRYHVPKTAMKEEKTMCMRKPAKKKKKEEEEEEEPEEEEW